MFSVDFMSELVDREGREFEDATIFEVQAILEILLCMSQRSVCFLVKAKCQVLRSDASSEFLSYRTLE